MKPQRRKQINGEYGRNGILQGGLPFIMTTPGFKHSAIPFVVILIRISAT
jgi:hypothetical protein